MTARTSCAPLARVGRPCPCVSENVSVFLFDSILLFAYLYIQYSHSFGHVVPLTHQRLTLFGRVIFPLNQSPHSPSLLRTTDKKTFRKVKLDLHDILSITTTGQSPSVCVEPLVTMGQLTAALLPVGWTVPVLPELDDLTIGGLIAGVGVESSSHIYGLFQHICMEFEVALADGSVVFCSPEKNAELFYNLPWSHGTLGFLLSATIRIIPAKQYVKLEYFAFTNGGKALEMFERESRKGVNRPPLAGTQVAYAAAADLKKRMEGGVTGKGEGDEGSSPVGGGREDAADYVEALAYSREHVVVMLGTMVDTPEGGKEAGKVNALGKFWKPWFFKHVEGFLVKGGKEGERVAVEYVPLRHYYHRHSKSLFWEIQDIIPFGNNVVFRYLFGWMMPPRISLLKLTQTEALRKLYEEHHVVQDMLVPVKDLGEGLDVFEEVFGVYPLWLCPMRIPKNPDYAKFGGFVKPLEGGKDEMFVDVGAYGNPSMEGFNAREACRKAEDWVRAKKGYQMMYADSFMTREEFREMFDHSKYDELRRRMDLCLQAFPEVYDKVSKAARV